MARVRDFLTFYFRNNFRQKNCKNGVKNPYMLVTRFPLVLTVYRWGELTQVAISGGLLGTLLLLSADVCPETAIFH